jgi:hypothetical protein
MTSKLNENNDLFGFPLFRPTQILISELNFNIENDELVIEFYSYTTFRRWVEVDLLFSSKEKER